MRHLLASMFVVLLLASVSYAIDDPALVLYCPFEEAQGDITTDLASELVGQLNNVEWSGDGKAGSCLKFTGTGSYVEFPDDAILDITKEITMEAWIRPDQVQADSAILGRRTPGNAGGYCMQWTNAMVEMWVDIGGWKGTRGKQAMKPAIEEWHHIAGVFTGDKIIQYMDGEVDTELDQAGSMGSVPEVFRIGQAQTSLTSMLGLIDEVAIYSRALTADEIKTDMEKGVMAPVSPLGSICITWGAIREE